MSHSTSCMGCSGTYSGVHWDTSVYKRITWNYILNHSTLIIDSQKYIFGTLCIIRKYTRYTNMIQSSLNKQYLNQNHFRKIPAFVFNIFKLVNHVLDIIKVFHSDFNHFNDEMFKFMSKIMSQCTPHLMSQSTPYAYGCIIPRAAQAHWLEAVLKLHRIKP